MDGTEKKREENIASPPFRVDNSNILVVRNRQLTGRRHRDSHLAQTDSAPLQTVHGRMTVMENPAVVEALDGLLEPLSRCLDTESAQRVAEFRLNPALQARIDILAERANDGVLSDDERAEYEAFVDAVDFISIFQIKSQRQLKSNGG